MRHRKSGKKLGRTWEHRKAMFKNMAKSLIVHERIRTTVPKAKELSRIVDKLVTLAIRNDLSARREAYKVLENHKLVQRLFNEIGPKFTGGSGGYTRVVKFAQPRVGDSAAMAMIEFTYFEAQPEDTIKPKAAAAPSAAKIAADSDKAETAPAVSTELESAESRAVSPDQEQETEQEPDRLEEAEQVDSESQQDEQERKDGPESRDEPDQTPDADKETK